MNLSPLFIPTVLILLFFAYKAWAGPCEFGCEPYKNCMPCSMVRDEDGELRTNNAPGWCWIRGKEDETD